MFARIFANHSLFVMKFLAYICSSVYRKLYMHCRRSRGALNGSSVNIGTGVGILMMHERATASLPKSIYVLPGKNKKILNFSLKSLMVTYTFVNYFGKFKMVSYLLDEEVFGFCGTTSNKCYIYTCGKSNYL